MTEEHQPATESPSGTQPPPTVPVGNGTEGVRDGSRDLRLEEPFGASRASPYAVAAFVVSAVTLFTYPQISFLGFGAQGQPVTRLLVATIPPVASAVIALWLAGRGEEEIYVADGRLGGLGFCRAARVISIVVLVFVVISLLLALLTRASGVVDFGV